MIRNSIYINFILKNVPKLCTQINRDEDSPTFGSCDRNFWHLKIRDFSSAILQQAGLTIALLYNLNFRGNYFYKNDNVYKWAKSTVNYWKKIQLKDGSFNEYYPNEHGFPPTAFTLFSSCEIYKQLNLNDKNLISSYKKSGKYLVNNIEKDAFNQEIASITALYSLYSIINETWIIDGINYKLKRVLKYQSKEGWFPEYGGCDFGYLSVTLDMLAEYYYQSKDNRVIAALEKIIEFIKYFVHPDGTIGGEYGSRNTEYFLPNGLEIMINLGNKDAFAIKRKIYQNIYNNKHFLYSIDDRYFSHYVMHSFLRALEKEKNISMKNIYLPNESACIKYFKEAGLICYSNKNYYSIISLKKGGIIKVFYKYKEEFTDFGYRIIKGKNKISITNWLDNNYKICWDGLNTAKISGHFNIIKLQISTPLKHFVLRILSFLFGKSIIGLLKKKLIFISKHDSIEFIRKIKFKKDSIILIDMINSKKPIDLKSANSLSLRHVASGKFFKNTEIIHKKRIYLKNITNVKITQIFDLESKEVLVKHEELD